MIIGFVADIGDMWRETRGAIQCDSKEFDVIRKQNGRVEDWNTGQVR